MFLLPIAGLVLLVAGAEALVRGASEMAESVGIPSVIVGLTVVAFGTSAAELVVSIKASAGGQAGLALGNVIGSNVFNVLFILGVAAIVRPLIVSARLVRLDVPVCIGLSVGVLLLATDGAVSRIEGGALVLGLLAYTAFLVAQARAASSSTHPPDAENEKSGADGEPRRFGLQGVLLNGGIAAGGLALLVLGAGWFVGGAVAVAKSFGISDLVVGLTIVAAGTSLPELATSVLATLRGERDVAVGNVVGSNIFNLLAVLGVSAAASPDGVPVSQAALWFDLPVMVAVSVACLPIFFTGHRISRWEGALFSAYYGAYVTYLVLAATQHEGLSSFSVAMGAFALPITGVTLLILTFRSGFMSDREDNYHEE